MTELTREQWLKTAEQAMAPWVEAAGVPYPKNTRVSCGFPKASRGRNKSIGQCWTGLVSADKTIEMFISPTQASAPRVCDILLHEMVHAAVGVEHGHKKPFIHVARALGLDGRITATFAGPELAKRLDALLATLPPYPHAEMNPAEYRTAKQKTALLKVECASCGYVARVTAKWLDGVGAPICPCNRLPMDRI